MAESIVSLVAERLGDFLIQEAKYLHGVSGQVEQMQFELELIQGYLEDADKWQDKDRRVQIWVSKIREAAYDVEAVIDTFGLKIASRRRRGIRNKLKRCVRIFIEAAELHKLGSEIEVIKTRISNLTRCLETYGIKHTREGEGSSSVQQRQQRWKESYSHVEEDTVGLDKDIPALVAKLVNEGIPAVSICGMGGLGKTTLAKKVYHHSQIRGHFRAFAWAYVSQQCQRRDVWQGILFNLISPSKEERDVILKLRDEELANQLSEVQKEKKCLVILDDIWTTEAWESLSLAFPIGKSESQMLLTTRNKEVIGHIYRSGSLHKPLGQSDSLYELHHLTEDESWELFQKKAFPRKDEAGFSISKDMEELGRKMVGRCAGLPLGITVLGGLLATKHSFNEWKMMYENIDSYFRDGKGHEQHSKGLFGVLALSYHELPYRLKPCFLHLGHFPEDFNIPTKKLVRIWVAEGIVSCLQHELKGEKTVEAIAECYLNELVDRCVVQVGERSSSGRVKTCHLHDLMRDLCLVKANQENFLRIVDVLDGNKLVDSPSPTVTIAKSTAQIHRLALYGEETLKFFPKQESTRTHYVRSLLFFKTTKGPSVNFLQVTSLFKGFELLRVLHLEKCPIEGKLPKEIGNLIHLRYLSVNCSRMTKIPSSIGNLKCLQTLVLNGDENILNVPNVIWKMVQLRHLYISKILSRSSKLGLGDLRNLQTLQAFDTRNFNVEELSKLTNLRKLDIDINVEELSKLTNLRKLDIDMSDPLQELKEILKSPCVNFDRLRSLKIDWVMSPAAMDETNLQRLFSTCHNLYNLYLKGWIVKLPKYPQFPKNLTKLTLKWSQLEEDPMPTLEKLPYLSILRLFFRSFNGKEMVCSSKGFPQLKYLHLRGLLGLEEWRVGEEEIRFVGEEEEEEWCVGKEAAMPNLSHLLIEECPYLRKIPNGLRFITTLRNLDIRAMPTDFRNRLQEGGEDYDKVRHVPSITFAGIF